MKSLDKIILLSIPLISISAEVLKSFFENSQVMAARTILCMALVMILVIKNFRQVLQFNISLILLIIYLLVILLIQEASTQSFQSWTLFTESKLMLPLAFIIMRDEHSITSLSKVLFWIGVIFSISIIYFLTMNIGINQYGGSDGFTVGSFKYNRLYTGSFILLSLPLVFSYLRKKWIKNLIPVLALLVLIILILSTRRTSLIIVLAGMMVFALYYYRKLPYILAGIFAFFVLLALTFPLYKNTLLKQLEKRQHVFIDQGGFDLESETRFEESIAVWKERINSHRPATIFFGEYLFNSAGNYDQGIHGIRPLHLDINVFLHGSGIIGLILFTLFYLELVFNFLKYQSVRLNSKSRLIEATGAAVILPLTLLPFSGGMLAVTHQMIAGLIAGTCLRLMAKHYQRNNLIESEDKPLVFSPKQSTFFLNHSKAKN